MRKLLKAIKSALDMARAAKSVYKRSYLGQIRDIWRLKRVNPTCGISDYYWYQMPLRRPGADSDYTNYLGWRAQRDLSAYLNPRFAITPAKDKLLFTVLAETYGIPTAKIKGAFKPLGPVPAFIPHAMGSIAEVRAFLENPEIYPVFVKPSCGARGVGGFLLLGLDEDSGEVVSKTGEQLSIDDFIARSIDNPKRELYRRESGYLFQEVVRQHAEIAAFAGTEVPSGMRIIVYLEDDGPVLHRAVWKLAAPGNANDNFGMGRYGNLIADVDLETGTVQCAVDGMPPNCHFLDRHPVTGRLFSDFRFPLWEETKAQVLAASVAFPMLRMQHWDVVLTDNGPIFLELNDLGATEMIQINGRPILDSRIKALLRDRGGLPPDSKLRKLVEQGV